jgi:hypothetical protein
MLTTFPQLAFAAKVENVPITNKPIITLIIKISFRLVNKSLLFAFYLKLVQE